MKTARSVSLLLLAALGAGLLGAAPSPAAETPAPGVVTETAAASEPLFESTVLATSGQGAHTYRIPA
ncbi:hypothetical protein ACFTZM_35315, partial [Streptomyces hydrogenans]